jgi:hypothetical protein
MKRPTAKELRAAHEAVESAPEGAEQHAREQVFLALFERASVWTCVLVAVQVLVARARGRA